MHPYLQNIAIIAYVCAMGLALAHLVQRQAYVHRLAVLATLVGWIAHTLALVVLAIEIGGPPLGTLPNAVSVVVWVVVLLEMLVERQSGVTVLAAFVLPVVVLLNIKSSVAHPFTLPPAAGTGAARRTSPSSASRRSWSRSVPGSFCPDGTAPDAAVCRGHQPQERAAGAARAARRRRGQGPRDPARSRGRRRAARGGDPLDVQPRGGLRRGRRTARGARGRLPPPVPAARRGGDGCRGGPVHARRGRRDPPRLSRGLEPRLDDDRRAADPRPGQGRLRARAGLRGGGAGAAHAL